MSYDFIIEQGVIVSDTSLFKTEVEDEFKVIFGGNFVTDDDTPEGQLINQFVQTRKDVSDNNAQMANQINPNEAGGVLFDAIWALTGGGRSAAGSTLVDAVIAGVLDTFVAAGSIASDGINEFQLLEDATLNTTGSPFANVTFSAIIPGPTSIAAGQLTTVVSPILGWETVTNGADGTPGTNVQSDVSSQNERRAEVGLQGMSMSASVFANVRAVEFVLSLSFRDNVLGTVEVIDGISLSANSTWAAVDAGDNPTAATKLLIAEALLESKTGGANWTGTDVVQAVIDPNSGQSQTVRYDLTTYIPIRVRVTISASSTTSNPTQAVKDAVLAYALGEVGSEDPGLITGVSVAPPEIGAAIGSEAPGIFTQKIEVSYNAPVSYTQDLLAIAINERATVLDSAITVIII